MLWILGLVAIVAGIIVVLVRPGYRHAGYGLVGIGIVLVLLHLFVGGAIDVPEAASLG